ncbi:molecular chaperone SurA [Pseudoxanthomonas broegbernensis]|uniref:Chaperone SurA n=1 Tax=Pseudoxanthomonas broegbernensis TaxID=83619 RepID=A0A7V8GK87_9GAMM|nr:peptidylprolyl isomerase [Pseudoxanthomonas broegbernensis]KAF1684798.1 molecular chaperone SurA [Pseudoxanthomonas broegbernensis]MBB6066346.1 peptidyl-prolyl cis-trans isomerase SurA [Pseudoxanthomonas broegbernensis]
MSRRLPAILLAVAALLSVPFAVVAQQAQPLEGIAAIVDEDVILQSELNLALRNVVAQYAGRENQLPPRAVLERQVLERLVLVKLQVARAHSNGIRIGDQEINQTVAAIAQQNGLTVDGLRQRLVDDGLNFEEFRRSLADEITVQHMRQSFAQRVNVSEGEVDAALAQQASGGHQYRLSHILVALPDGATAEQIATGQSKIDGIKGVIEKGEMDFAAAAVRYSDSPNALEGGDLGWRTLDEIPPAFAQQIRQLQPGEIFGPVRGASGFQLLRLAEVRDTNDTSAQSITEYHIRHILVRVNDRQDEAAARAKIDTLRARIDGGADFQEVARESSEDNGTRGQGGDLGWFPADAYGEDFGRQVTALADGDISQPFRSEAGWHLLQRVGERQSDVTDLNRRGQVRETIGRRKLEEEYERYLQEMRGEAYVVFRVGDRAESVGGASVPGG